MMKKYYFGWNVLNTLLILLSLSGNAEIVTKPKSTTVQVGSSVRFNCSTSLADEIHWFHYAVGANERSFVFGYGKFYAPYEGRIELEHNGTDYDILIASVKFEDAGKYECQDQKGGGDKMSAHLNILEQGPICQSSKNIDKIIGSNSCGIEADVLVLTCTIQYRGNEVPILEWRNIATTNVITDGITVETGDNYTRLNLTMKGDLSMDKATYLCQISISTPIPYSCDIGPIKVTGKSDKACNYYVNATIVLVIIIGCLILVFLITLWCIIKRHRNERRAADQKISPEEVPLRPIEEKKVSKPKKADTELVNKMQKEIEHQKQRLKEMEQHLYPPESINYLEKSKWLHTIRAESAESVEKNAICGIAILDPSLFVVFENSNEIEVYESVTFNRKENIVIKEMTNPLDITSSKTNNCFYLYVTDHVDNEPKSRVLRINEKGELIKQWKIDAGPGRLSSFESNVIACLHERHEIYEYSEDGELLNRVPLSPALGFKSPLHAIKVTSMHFLVSHTGDLHRVCVVDLDGKVIKEFSKWTVSSFISKSDEKMNVPMCLAENSDRFVVVADRNNKQVLLLNSVLKFELRLIVCEESGLKYHPVRLAFGEKGNLFIAENCRLKSGWQSGRISVFATKNSSEQNG